MPLDLIAERRAEVSAVLKIDTEITEPAILDGARVLIEHHRPWIIVEVLARRTEEQLAPIVERHGYLTYRIDDTDPLEQRSTIEGDPSYAHMDWLLAPEPLHQRFHEALRRWRAELASCIPAPAAPHGALVDALVQPMSLAASARAREDVVPVS